MLAPLARTLGRNLPSSSRALCSGFQSLLAPSPASSSSSSSALAIFSRKHSLALAPASAMLSNFSGSSSSFMDMSAPERNVVVTEDAGQENGGRSSSGSNRSRVMRALALKGFVSLAALAQDNYDTLVSLFDDDDDR